MKFIHPLMKYDKYIKEYYLITLCVIANYDNNKNSDEQINFLKELKDSLLLKEPIQKYLEDALKIDEKYTDEIHYLFSNNKIKYYLAIDGFKMLSLDNISDKQVQLFNEILKVSNVKSEEINFIKNLIVVIEKKDIDSIKNIFEKNSSNIIEKSVFYNYLKPFDKNILIFENDNTKIFNAVNKSSISEYVKDKRIELKNKNYVFKNIVFDYKKLKIIAENLNKISFIDCIFINCDCIYFENVNKIMISKCKFKEISNRAIIAEYFNEFDIEKCEFKDCGLKYHDSTAQMGGVIAGTGEKLRIIESTFEDCYIKNSYKSETTIEAISIKPPIYSIGVLIEGKIEVKDSFFRNCWSYDMKGCVELSNIFKSYYESKGIVKDDEVERHNNGLFPKEDCTYSNCKSEDSADLVG